MIDSGNLKFFNWHVRLFLISQFELDEIVIGIVLDGMRFLALSLHPRRVTRPFFFLG